MPACAALAADEAGVIAHMNSDHADAIAVYAGADLAAGWRMLAATPKGATCALRALETDRFSGAGQRSRGFARHPHCLGP